MSPLFLVGITLLTTTWADVSHVLSGSAHPPANPDEINNAFQSKNPQDFWWMKNDSPLKASYDFYKKCSSTGKCPTSNVKSVAQSSASASANFGPIDASKNVFLNGEYANGKGNAVVSAASSGGKAASFHSGVNLDLSNNPFLQGQIATAANGDQIRDENGFIGVQPSVPFKGQGFSTSHPLLNKQPFSTSHPANQPCNVLGEQGGGGTLLAKQGGATILGQQGGANTLGQDGASRLNQGGTGSASGAACQGSGRICVPKENCVNGVVKNGEEIIQVRQEIQYCNLEKEICCVLPGVAGNAQNVELHLPSLSGKTALPGNINDLIYNTGKSSIPGSTIKLTGGNGFSPGQIQVVSGNSVDGKPELTFNGESGSPSTSAKPPREISASANTVFSSTVDYSDVKFDSDVRFASGIQGPAYLPPIAPPIPTISTYRPPVPTTSRPSCSPGQYLTSSGICEPIQKPCPFGTRPSPSGGCEKIVSPSTPSPSCSPGQIRGTSGQCVYVQTQRPTPQCSPGQIIGISGQCVYPSSPPQPQCLPGQILSSSGQCISQPTQTPKPQCAPGQILDNSGQCLYPATTPSRPQCAPGQILSASGQCTYPSKKPECGPGQILGISGQCVYPSTPTPRPQCAPGQCSYPTKKPECGPGQILTASGQCVYPSTPTPRPQCAPGQMLSASGQCTYVTKKPECGPGQILDTSGQCLYPPTPTPKPQCSPGQILSASGQCIYTSTSTSRPQCAPGQILSSSGQCTYVTRKPECSQGQILSVTGQCIYPTPSPRPQCAPGETLSITGQCVRQQTFSPSTPGYDYPKPTQPTECEPGFIKTSFGGCERPSPPKPSCPFGSFLGPSGNCERPPVPTSTPGYEYPKPCPPGTIKTASGDCARQLTTVRPSCPPGSFPTGSGGCQRPTSPRPQECSPGLIKTLSGSCVSPSTPPPRPICPSGSYLTPSGNCERPQAPSSTPGYEYPKPCPPGTIKTVSGECVTKATTTRPSCPPGSYVTASGDCQRPTSPQPQGCPPGLVKTPFGTCESPSSPIPRPTCPSGSYLGSSGICERPSIPSTTPSYEYPKPCPPGTLKSPTGECQLTSPPRPTCPLGTYPTPTGGCEPPVTSPRPPLSSTTSRDYLPPIKETPTPQPNPTGGYIYNKPTPTFDYSSSTLTPNSNSINNQYVRPTTKPPFYPTYEQTGTNIESDVKPPPDRPDNTGAFANNTSVFALPPTRSTPFPENNQPPAGCAAALKCVQEIYCTADGFVSPVPVVLTKEQELLRAPTTTCLDQQSGIIGKCCRDPNYKDPWPSANLVNGVDDGQYKEDDSIAQYKDNSIQNNRLVRSDSQDENQGSRIVRSDVSNSQPTCGERHYNTQPLGPGPLDANFAEIPWQAMILRDSNRSLLCGGVIIRRNAVLTAAHCVEGLETSDVLIKGGEWKLGIDEEPLPFQIVKVAAIVRHPSYEAGSFLNDMAVLVLEENLRLTKNVGTLCLPQPNQIPTQNCIATGWGKRILQLHAKGAIMHKIQVNVMDNQQCKQTLSEKFQNSLSNHSPNILCGYSDINQCKVDYGSALACANESGQYVLSGIYSWDTGCKEKGQIGGYVAPDVDWIEHTLTLPLKEVKKLDREYRSRN